MPANVREQARTYESPALSLDGIIAPIVGAALAANVPERYADHHVCGIDAEFASCRSLPQGSYPPLFASRFAPTKGRRVRPRGVINFRELGEIAFDSYTQSVWYSWPTVAAQLRHLTRTRFSQSKSAATGSDEQNRQFAGEAHSATSPLGRMRKRSPDFSQSRQRWPENGDTK